MLRQSTVVILFRSADVLLLYFLNILVARYASVQIFGEFAIAQAASILLAPFLTAGAGSAAIRFVSIYEAKDRRDGAISFLISAMIVLCVTTIVTGILLSIINLFFFQSRASSAEILLFLIYVFGLAGLNFNIGYSRARGRFVRAFLPPALARALPAIFFLVFFVAGPNDTIQLVDLLGMLATGSVIAAILVIGPEVAKEMANFDLELVRRNFLEWYYVALPLMIVSGIQLGLTQLDVILAAAFLSVDELAAYAAAARTALVISFALSAINAIAGPRIAVLAAKTDFGGLQRYTALVCNICFVVGVAMFVAVALLGDDLLRLFNSSFTIAFVPLLILCAGQLVNASVGPVASILNLSGYQQASLMAHALILLLMVILIAILSKVFGLLGVSLATSLSVIMLNLMLAVLVFRRTKVVSVPFARSASSFQGGDQ